MTAPGGQGGEREAACNCAHYGNALQCPHHTQEDFVAADVAIGREWPACSTYPNLECVCRGAVMQSKANCTRKRTGDLTPVRRFVPPSKEANDV